jgi:hypothetical protein
MSRNAGITCAAVLSVMAKPQNRLMTLLELGAVFGITDQGAWYHIKKLLEAGDVFMSKRAGGGIAAQYSLTNPPESTKYVGDVAPAFRVNRYTPPLTGYGAKLRAAADLAMAGRA